MVCKAVKLGEFSQKMVHNDFDLPPPRLEPSQQISAESGTIRVIGGIVTAATKAAPSSTDLRAPAYL